MTTLILENTLLKFVESVIIIFVINGVFVGICLFTTAKTIAISLRNVFRIV